MVGKKRYDKPITGIWGTDIVRSTHLLPYLAFYEHQKEMANWQFCQLLRYSKAEQQGNGRILVSRF